MTTKKNMPIPLKFKKKDKKWGVLFVKKLKKRKRKIKFIKNFKTKKNQMKLR